ncbi:MAG: hypothetical protein ACRDS0_04655 [Pseudonocardiaceae bacterium]
MTRQDPARWALSPLDTRVHMVTLTVKRSKRVLTARCGHLLPTATHDYDQPPPGAPCERCRLLFLADFATGASPVTHAQFR